MKHRSLIRFAAEGFESLVVTVCVILTWPISKHWLEDWGSQPEEQVRELPGDGLVTTSHKVYTRGISISAPTSRIWPWIVQYGLGRAGFYSYELLERVVGIPVKNIESIVPKYQHLAVGDEILLHPKAPGIPVALLERNSHICFGVEKGLQQEAEKPDRARSWSIYLVAESDASSRLLLRGCIEPLKRPNAAKRLAGYLEEPIDFIMEQRMLRTLKRLAESS